MVLPLLGLVIVVFGPPIASRALNIPRWQSYPLDGFAASPLQSGLQAGCAGARDACPANARSSNPDGGTPIVGLASASEYQWCHVVREVDAASPAPAATLARLVTGDSKRGPELVAANPDKATAIVDVDGQRQIDFAPGALCPHERLLFPKGDAAANTRGWNDFVDQVGNPRGTPTPFPTSKAGS